MKILLTGYLGAGSTEIANMVAEAEKAEAVNSVRAIRDLIRERRESFGIFERESRSGEFDLDALLRNKALEYVESFDNLIVEGRLALLVLDKDFDLKAFLTASEEDRVKHVAARRNISIEKAARIIKNSDKEREQLVEKICDYPLDLTRFDVVLNTSTYGYEGTAHTLRGLIGKSQA